MRPCATDEAQRRLFGAGYEARWQQYQTQLAARPARAAQHRAQPPGTRLIIPVVVHIIHNGGGSNISDEQVFRAIDILNQDYQGRNADTAQVIPYFKARVADTNLEFRLARRDPQGNCSNGITRTFSALTTSADDNVKDLIGWDGTRYLNVWVVQNISFGAAGYAYLPCWVGPDIDGLVVLNSYFGATGNSSPRNRFVLTHEVGHYLGLPHTWGMTNDPGVAANCFDDDGVADTPNTTGSSVGFCNVNMPACAGDPDLYANVQNYMDYSYCSVMFTNGQAELMHDGLTMSSFGQCHATLTTAANLLVTGVADGLNLPPCAPDVAIMPGPGATETDVARGCTGDSVTFRGAAYNLPDSATTTWAWTFPGGQPATSTRQNPTVAYAAAGTYSVSLTAATPGAPAGTTTRAAFVRIADRTVGLGVPLIEDFEQAQFPLNPAQPAAAWDVAASTGAPGAGWTRTTTAQQGTGAVRVPLSAVPVGTTYTLTSPVIVVGSAVPRPIFTYQQAYAPRRIGDADLLEIAVSFDCGRTWTVRQRRAGGGLTRGNLPVPNGLFVPTAAQWHEERMGLGATLPAGTALRVRFTVTTANGNALYLDQLRLDSQPVVGVAAAAGQPLPPALTVVPNPSAGSDGGATALHVQLPPGLAATLRLTDATGRRLGAAYAVAAGTETAPRVVRLRTLAGPLAAGLYFVELTTATGARLTERLLIY